MTSKLTSRLASCLSILAIVIPTVRAQSSPEAEQKKAREKREKKTFALIDDILKETQAFRLPENRVRVAITLAGSLWSRDEKRARSLFKEAVTGLREISAAVDAGDSEYADSAQLHQQLRQDILNVVVQHDATLALDFLRSTRPSTLRQQYPEAQLEMRLAVQIAAKDPSAAFTAGEESIKLGLDYEAMNLLYTLDSHDKSAGEKFLGDILSQLRTADLNTNFPSAQIALTLLRAWTESRWHTAEQSPQRTTGESLFPNFDEQTARELTTIILNAALSNGPADSPAYQLYSGQVTGILQQLKTMLPDIERLSPGQMAPLRKRLAERDKFSEAQRGPWARYDEVFRTGTPAAMIEASRTAPPEIADRLVNDAATKAFDEGDTQNAYDIAEKIVDPRQRADMKSHLARQSFYKAREQKRVVEARALLSRLPSVEEQVIFLTQLAMFASTNGDRPTAMQVLEEAQGLLGYKALNYAQLQAQMRIANTYERLDAGRSVAIVERVIGQVNELTAAAFVLNGFDVNQYFRSGEFIIMGGNPLNMMAQECGSQLGRQAPDDLDRARTIAERFQRSEMRVIALMQIAQSMLAIDGQ